MDKVFSLFVTKNVSIREFIQFWSAVYSYESKKELEVYYNRIINKKQFTSEDLMKLYKWKNGGTLSERKNKSIKKINLKWVNLLKSKKENKFNSEEVLRDCNKKRILSTGAIWRIFLLHIIAPEQYPIFDQHVCRAFYFLTKKGIKEIPDKNKAKEEIYEKYIKFFTKLSKSNLKRKELDEALWAFGKFLKTPYGRTLFNYAH